MAAGPRLRDRRMTAINFVADAVNRSLDLKEIADNALHAIVAVTQADGGAVYLWQEQGAALRIFAWRGLPDLFVQQAGELRPGGVARLEAVLAGTTQVFEDFTVAPGVGQNAAARAGFHTAILCPIRTQGEVAGVLVLGNYQRSQFAAEDVELIEGITHQLGIAIANAQLLKDLSRKNALLELLIEEAHHRIKNNLQLISGLLQLGADAAGAGRGAEQLRQAVTRIQAIARVHNLLSEEMPDKVDAPVLLTSIVNALIGAAAPAGGPAVAALALEPLWLNADQAVAVALVVNELVANSLLHGQPPAGQRLAIHVACGLEAGRGHLVVADNGGGLKPGRAWPEHSTGQGAHIVTQLAQVNLRGTLQVGNRDGGLRAELWFEVAAKPA
jgi:two-component sensor histidine kinase/putative methionine-R-sulfoxide reductase with GAF domain